MLLGATIVTSWTTVTSPGTVSSQLPPLSPARSTITLPERIPSTAAAVTSFGAGRPGTSAVVMTMSKVVIASLSACCWLACSSAASARA